MGVNFNDSIKEAIFYEPNAWTPYQDNQLSKVLAGKSSDLYSEVEEVNAFLQEIGLPNITKLEDSLLLIVDAEVWNNAIEPIVGIYQIFNDQVKLTKNEQIGILNIKKTKPHLLTNSYLTNKVHSSVENFFHAHNNNSNNYSKSVLDSPNRYDIWWYT